MFKKWKQKREEKERARKESLLEQAKESACSATDSICIQVVSKDALKVLLASRCCVADEGGECNCAECPFGDDEECLSTLTDTAHKIAVFIGGHAEAKEKAIADAKEIFLGREEEINVKAD